MKNEETLELATRLVTLLQAEGLLTGNDSGPGMFVGKSLRLGLVFRIVAEKTKTEWGLTYARRILVNRKPAILDRLAQHVAKQLSAVELQRRLQQVTNELPQKLSK